jgi:hypothetical protein
VKRGNNFFWPSKYIIFVLMKFSTNAPKNWEKNISTLWTRSVFKEDCEALLVQIHDIYYMEKLIPDLYIIFWGLLENKYCKKERRLSWNYWGKSQHYENVWISSTRYFIVRTNGIWMLIEVLGTLEWIGVRLLNSRPWKVVWGYCFKKKRSPEGVFVRNVSNLGLGTNPSIPQNISDLAVREEALGPKRNTPGACP